MPEFAELQKDDLVAVARVAKPKGLRGEVIAAILTDFPERFEGLTNVTVVKPDGERLDLKIEEHSFQNGRVVLKFAGYDRFEEAETLRDADICVAEADAVELGEGEYFDWQLAGCKVETIGGDTIGLVRELMRTGGTELLVVAGDTKEYLIPFAEAICVEIDIDKQVIRIDPPEGLLDF